METLISKKSAVKNLSKDEFRDEIYELTKAHPRNEKEILELRSYPRAFVKFMGSNDGAVFLQQLIYWTERMKKRGDGFFYKSVREWSEELDITEYQVEKLRAFLKEKGVLEMKLRRVRHFKEQWHYRLNKERFKEVYQQFLDNEYKFPHEVEFFDFEEFPEVISDEREAEEFAENRETVARNQEPVSCAQETIPQDEETIVSIQETVSRFQENNNNVLHNKLDIELDSELGNEPYNFRDTQAFAKNSQTHYEEADVQAVADRNTGGNSISDARRALDAFRSVGVKSYDVTAKNDLDLQDYTYRENSDLDANLEQSIEWCEKKRFSFIVRPRGAALIQIDDCNAETLEVLLPFCFFAEETSKGNFQAWIALPEETTNEELVQVRNRLLKKLGKENGNGGSYGSTRWVGSINFKPSRNLFRVRLILAENGRFTSAEELDCAGLLAKPEKPRLARLPSKGFRGCFPDYDHCLRNTDNDRSDADASFLAICKDRGFSKDESIEQLEIVSERAQESGYYYIQRTADFVFGKED